MGPYGVAASDTLVATPRVSTLQTRRTADLLVRSDCPPSRAHSRDGGEASAVGRPADSSRRGNVGCSAASCWVELGVLQLTARGITVV
jgi:hypothetical protein